MELLHKKDFLSLKHILLTSMPFCFQEDYLKANEAIQILSFKGAFVPVKLNKVKFLKTIQFQFVPVSSEGERLLEDEERLFCSKAIEFIIRHKLAHRILQPSNVAVFQGAPKGTVVAPFGSYRINLQEKSEQDLLMAMQPRYRSAIHQAERLQAIVRFGFTELEAFQKLHEETMSRTSSYYESYDQLKYNLEQVRDHTILATVYVHGKIQGGLYVIYSPFSAYYLHGASTDSTEASGAIKFLHYKIMCLMKSKGVEYYDFVGARLSNVKGTKLEGIQNFKKRFGSELMTGYLWKMDIHKTLCHLYDLLLKVKCTLKRSPFPYDIIDQELLKTNKH